MNTPIGYTPFKCKMHLLGESDKLQQSGLSRLFSDTSPGGLSRQTPDMTQKPKLKITCIPRGIHSNYIICVSHWLASA